MLLVASGEDPNVFKQCKEDRPDLAMKLLEIRGDFIKHFSEEHQTEEMCLTAVTSCPEAIQYIYKSKQTETVCRTAVRTDPNVIEHIDDPSEHVYLIVVSKLPGLLRDIKNQTPLICNIAVTKAPMAIRFVDDQTYMLCLKSIRKDPTAIKYIRDPTPDLICRCIQMDPTLMGDVNVESLDLDICLSCAFLDQDSIDHIKDNNLWFDCLTEFTKFIT